MPALLGLGLAALSVWNAAAESERNLVAPPTCLSSVRGNCGGAWCVGRDGITLCLPHGAPR